MQKCLLNYVTILMHHINFIKKQVPILKLIVGGFVSQRCRNNNKNKNIHSNSNLQFNFKSFLILVVNGIVKKNIVKFQ